MGFEKTICIYCQTNVSTRKGDHVPPQSFFPEPRGFELIQVPCCQTCNALFSKDDEVVRDLLASEARNEQHDTVKKHLGPKRNRSWERSPSKVDDAIRHSKIVQTSAADGRSVNRLAMNLDRPECDRFFRRMGQAILWKYRNVLVKHEDFEWEMPEYMSPERQEKLARMVENGEPFSFGDEDFQFRAVSIPNRAEGVVFMRFFRGTEFLALFFNRQRLLDKRRVG